ncbi:MAG: DEAD/DEAH box helicase [Deltaproteobacteria bacterium]|nr:DEAD/DEAH box helicase [Deltaproteobacteria bacterium]
MRRPNRERDEKPQPSARSEVEGRDRVLARARHDRSSVRSPAPDVRPSPSVARRPAPWARAEGVEAVVARWQRSPRVRQCILLDAPIEAEEGQFADLPDSLDPALRDSLRARGISRLYAHQARAFDLARANRPFVIATPTASGKSLCYHLPVLDRLVRDPDARALYLFPTKALSRDQEESIRAMLHEAGIDRPVVTYDGDTPGDERRAARQRSSIVVTNPDMLHAGILPHHAAWSGFFANLRTVVLDELHTYRGVFGSHMAHVLHRLERVARFHGSDPLYVAASATIGNPREHASRLLGRDVEVIAESGAPRGPRRVLVYDPPVVDPERGIRGSYVKHAVGLAADLHRARVPTIVFALSRNNVEVMVKYIREMLAKDGEDVEGVQSYRGGYLPETRRRIERGLRDGTVRTVVATSALELGIDIGDLDAVVCAGWPGTFAGLWQRFGRAGRRGAPAVTVLVTSAAPMDQFVARAPEALLGAPIEEARIDPENVEVLVQHLKCAVFELPFEAGEPYGGLDAKSTGDALEFLASHGVVHASSVDPSPRTSALGSTYHWTSDAYPATRVSLRNIGWDNFVIVDVEHDRTLAELDWRSAHTMLHEQAIYQHEGEQYQVERLDHPNHKAFVRKVAPDYYTDAMTFVQVGVLSTDESGSAFGARSGRGDVSVVETVVGYKKIKFHTHENVGFGEVHLPEMQMHTTAAWWTVPEATVLEVAETECVPRSTVVDAVRALGHALHTVAAVALMCDGRDLGVAVGGESGSPGRSGAGPLFDPTVFLYDRYAGGIGLAPRVFDLREALLARARTMVAGCGCEMGCPACIGPPPYVEQAPVSRQLERGADARPSLALGRVATSPSPAAAGDGLTRSSPSEPPTPHNRSTLVGRRNSPQFAPPTGANSFPAIAPAHENHSVIRRRRAMVVALCDALAVASAC